MRRHSRRVHGRLITFRSTGVRPDLGSNPGRLALGDGSGRSLGVAHRDLHDKQLLAGGPRLGLLDFDTAALAEPALDLANLLVHAGLRRAQGRWPADRSAVAEAAVRRASDRLEVPEARLAAYAEATRLRLACVYAFRPGHEALAAAWATSTAPGE